jgi:hypothetical protein
LVDRPFGSWRIGATRFSLTEAKAVPECENAMMAII